MPVPSMPGPLRRRAGGRPLCATVLMATLAILAAACAPPGPPGPGGRRVIHVSQSAASGGDGSVDRPLRKVQDGLALATPGDAVAVGPGTYREEVETLRAGTPQQPIRLIGSSAKIVGEGSGHAVDIMHSYVTFQGFDVSGDDILVWVEHATGVVVADNVLHDANGECVRVKYQSHDNEVARNHIGPCGLQGFNLSDNHKNGEGVYIGTAPEQLYRNPTHGPDHSDRNRVHDNVMVVPAECVDVKEAATDNLVDHNRCSGGQDPESGGFSSRGQHTMYRDNTVNDEAGAGIRLGGDGATDGINSEATDNWVKDVGGYGFKVERSPQGQMCGNHVDNAGGGIANGDTDPTQPC